MPQKTSGFGILVAGDRLDRRVLRRRDRVADVNVLQRLQVGDEIADATGLDLRRRRHARREVADLGDLVLALVRQELDARPFAHLAVEYAHVDHHAAVVVVHGVVDHGAQRRLGISLRRRALARDGLQHLVHALARLGGDAAHVGRIEAEPLGDLDLDLIGHRTRQVDLVEHGDDLEPRFDREIGVGHRLRFDALGAIDQQNGALARLQRAGDLVAEIDVARGVDQIERQPLVGHLDGTRLDRDAALALQLHRVEQLVLHLALRHHAGGEQQPIGQRRLAVVDVGDDAEVAQMVETHGKGGL